MTDKLTQKGRVTLVTGASRGIGYETALEIARRGGEVIALARTQGAREELDDAVADLPGATILVPLDLRQPENVEQLAKIVKDRWGRLDGLVGNAGLLGQLTPVSQIEPKVWGETFTVNFHANWALIRAFEGLLKQSEAGRAVFVTSGAARKHRAYWSAYAASKAALDAMVSCWAKELEPSNAKANLLNPGPTKTAMRAQAMPGEDPDSNPSPDAVARLIADMIEADYRKNDALIEFKDVAKHYSA